jgi:uncharacterized protein YbaA (DUF1428 family)
MSDDPKAGKWTSFPQAVRQEEKVAWFSWTVFCSRGSATNSMRW